MKYYDGHESVYAKIEKNGGKHWADRKEGQGLEGEHRHLKSVLDHLFSTVTFSNSPRDAMDLGCGTGTVSGYLAKQGFRTLGIDVSPSAIRLAQRFAAENGLVEARFAVTDIVHYPDPQPSFDLIIDSQCMHCIVFNEDRARALVNIRRWLKPGGVFVFHTKSTGPEKDLPENCQVDETGILWVPSNMQFDESKQINGKWYMPQRRILPPETLQKEAIAAGFSIQWWQAQPSVFSVICTLPKYE